MKHIVNHINNPCLRSDNTLHVIGVISNPVRWHSRYRLAREFIERMECTANVKFYLVEAAYGDRRHELELKDHERYRSVKIHSNAWIKENLINVGVAQLFPYDWKYMAWLDCDILFRDPHWAQETLHQLQHFDIVQPWSQCADLGHHGNIVSLFHSFGYIHQRGDRKQVKHDDGYQYAHSGMAWACTRRFWENLPRGLMDFCILGSGDWHMAWAAIGNVGQTLHFNLGPAYEKRCYDWQRGAVAISHKQVGFVQGRIEHFFHGNKINRYYKSRNQILKECGYDPDKHLRYDDQGIIHIVGNHRLEHAIHNYNLSRREDGID